MITLLSPEQEQAFREACSFHPVTGPVIYTLWGCYGEGARDVHLWLAHRDGVPAAAISRSGGWLEISAGPLADWSELREFLQVLGGFSTLHIRAEEWEKLGLTGSPSAYSVMICPEAPPVPAHSGIHPAPALGDVFDILREGDPDFREQVSWEAWYTHNSHLIRHGFGFAAALYEGTRAVSTAGVYNRGPRHDLIGSVATRQDSRGRGCASALTLHLTGRILGEGKLPCLYCEPALIPFYRRLGFEEAGRLYRVQIAPPPEDS